MEFELCKFLPCSNNALNTLPSSLNYLHMVNITSVTARDMCCISALQCIQPPHLREVVQLMETKQTQRGQSADYSIYCGVWGFYIQLGDRSNRSNGLLREVETRCKEETYRRQERETSTETEVGTGGCISTPASATIQRPYSRPVKTAVAHTETSSTFQVSPITGR